MGSALDLSIYLELYDKSYKNKVIEIFKKYLIGKPVFIVEMSNYVKFEFETDYPQWELQNEIENIFEDCFFTEDVGGQVEVMLKIRRSQSPFSSDDWGRRWNEDYIITTTYLVKKSEENDPDIPKSDFQVLFNDEIKNYKVHLAVGRYKDTDELFYAVLKKEFVTREDIEFLSDKNFNNVGSAFWEGFRLLRSGIEEEYEKYTKTLKSKRKRKK